MNQYELKKAFVNGDRVYGTPVASPSPKRAAELKKAGVDFAFIDTEHIPLDRSIMSWMCQGNSANGIAPTVRIGVGNHFSGSKEKQLLWASKGMNIIVWNSDIQRFIQVMSDDINEMKTALGDSAEKQNADVII